MANTDDRDRDRTRMQLPTIRRSAAAKPHVYGGTVAAPGTSVLVDFLPDCDFCDHMHPLPYVLKATVDGRTRADSPGRGKWAYMCDGHWRAYGVNQLGLGYGQKLIPMKGPSK